MGKPKYFWPCCLGWRSHIFHGGFALRVRDKLSALVEPKIHNKPDAMYYLYISVYIYIYIYICYVCVYLYIYIHIHTCMYVYTYVHVRNRKPESWHSKGAKRSKIDHFRCRAASSAKLPIRYIWPRLQILFWGLKVFGCFCIGFWFACDLAKIRVEEYMVDVGLDFIEPMFW